MPPLKPDRHQSGDGSWSDQREAEKLPESDCIRLRNLPHEARSETLHQNGGSVLDLKPVAGKVQKPTFLRATVRSRPATLRDEVDDVSATKNYE